MTLESGESFVMTLIKAIERVAIHGSVATFLIFRRILFLFSREEPILKTI